jgi:excisionase family DNA binding protein
MAAKLISIQEAAKLLGITPQSVRNWINSGYIKGHKVGDHLVVNRETIEQYFDSLKDLAHLEKSVHDKTEQLREENIKLDNEIIDILESRDKLEGARRGLFRWIAQYATMSSFGLFTEKQQTVYREMMSMGDSEHVAKKLGITRSRVIEIFLNCLKIIAQTINLKKDKEKWEKLEKENQQLKFLTATLRQELEDLKDSKPVEPKKFKTEEELLNDKLNTSIYNFAFSIRAIHVLEGVGCKTLGDVKNLQKGDLRNIPNCGLKTIKDIEEVLEANGLSLKDIES